MAFCETGLIPDTDLFIFMFSLDPRSKRVAQGAERSQPVEVKHRKKKEGGGLVISPAAGPGRAERVEVEVQ